MVFEKQVRTLEEPKNILEEFNKRRLEKKNMINDN